MTEKPKAISGDEVDRKLQAKFVETISKSVTGEEVKKAYAELDTEYSKTLFYPAKELDVFLKDVFHFFYEYHFIEDKSSLCVMLKFPQFKKPQPISWDMGYKELIHQTKLGFEVASALRCGKGVEK